MDDIYKDRNETKESSREVCIGLKEDFGALGDAYDQGTKITAIIELRFFASHCAFTTIWSAFLVVLLPLQ
jgi:hypothetical protein